jgi:hypothetical protein
MISITKYASAFAKVIALTCCVASCVAQPSESSEQNSEPNYGAYQIKKGQIITTDGSVTDLGLDAVRLVKEHDGALYIMGDTLDSDEIYHPKVVWFDLSSKQQKTTEFYELLAEFFLMDNQVHLLTEEGSVFRWAEKSWEIGAFSVKPKSRIIATARVLSGQYSQRPSVFYHGCTPTKQWSRLSKGLGGGV